MGQSDSWRGGNDHSLSLSFGDQDVNGAAVSSPDANGGNTPRNGDATGGGGGYGGGYGGGAGSDDDSGAGHIGTTPALGGAASQSVTAGSANAGSFRGDGYGAPTGYGESSFGTGSLYGSVAMGSPPLAAPTGGFSSFNDSDGDDFRDDASFGGGGGGGQYGDGGGGYGGGAEVKEIELDLTGKTQQEVEDDVNAVEQRTTNIVAVNLTRTAVSLARVLDMGAFHALISVNLSNCSLGTVAGAALGGCVWGGGR